MTEWHIITSEYPPQMGGVSDYTHLLASALAAAGDSVHVWCPVGCGDPSPARGVAVQRELGRFTPRDFRRASKKLGEFSAPRRMLVQWVPHGYGYWSMNLHFCNWLWSRATFHHDRVEIMVHEPFLAFGHGSFKQTAAAAVHRVMSALLLGRGSVPQRDELLRQHPNLARQVHATGALAAADLSRHLSACDVLIQPYPDGVSSRRGSVMAGLSHGLPIVTTVGHLTEGLWAESGAVALAPAGDVATLARLTERLLRDKTERNRLSAAAKALYEQRFDLGHTVAALRAADGYGLQRALPARRRAVS